MTVLTSSKVACAEVSRRIRKFVADSGLAVEQFARVLDVSPADLLAYMSGEVVPDAVTFVQAESIPLIEPRLSETRALTIKEIGSAIAGAEGESERLRLFFDFFRGADESEIFALALIDAEPVLCDDPRFDALLAAAAEHVAARYARPGPVRSADPERFLDHAWWVCDLPSARAFAMLGTPASFRRRGIYIDRYDLGSV